MIESLRELEGERRCWHQVGVVLAEKKVSEIVPILNLNRDHVSFVSLSFSYMKYETPCGTVRE